MNSLHNVSLRPARGLFSTGLRTATPPSTISLRNFTKSSATFKQALRQTSLLHKSTLPKPNCLLAKPIHRIQPLVLPCLASHNFISARLYHEYDPYRRPSLLSNPLVKTGIAVSVGITALFLVQPIFFALLGGAVGYGAYRAIKGVLESRFPSQGGGSPLDIFRSQTNRRVKINDTENPFSTSPFGNGIFSNLVNDMLKSTANPVMSSIKNAAAASENLQQKSIQRIESTFQESGDLKYLFQTNVFDSIRFQPPYTVASTQSTYVQSQARSTGTQMKIQFQALNMKGDSANVTAVGMVADDGDVDIKKIQVEFPMMGRSVVIPLSNSARSSFQNPSTNSGPRIFEGEFRDVK
ncbi:hypothetical protein K493DRAFT_350693 [Basidiobolus meristosporus CBS 931.73]|uniref:Uncharacterized protein n=1 Tax=Basidiobolus meristosporus CBS 931.73 TaxID=1314790 RepID=A0A1Y1YFS8_9FUNG|nr:hypothetical protein K493DRAFT_350693 [Basidiobolus meristosporus CBS 931.73]|eukprot:ORX96566.1 hypothetical protein K493DRAFT_350693 [Basidiobolus meristosporus CBS 931.73]